MNLLRRSLFTGIAGLLAFTASAQGHSSGHQHHHPHHHQAPSGETVASSKGQLEAIDQFGHHYTPQDLSLPVSASRSGGSTCVAGHFTLCFEDVQMSRQYGFDDPMYGAQRRGVVCQVFTDLSQLIQSPIGAGGVRINVAASEGTDPNGFTVNVLAPTAAAVASDINLLGFSNGITYGMVWKSLVGGVDPYNGLSAFGFNSTSFHGMIRVNFENVPYHLVDFGNPGTPVPSGQMDLYSAVLHESVHLLGFYSLVDAANNNVSVFAANGSNRLYNRYDLELDLNISGTATPLVNYSAPYATAPITTILNNAPGNCDYSVDFNGNATPGQAIYMPSGANWSGSGLSHLNCDAAHPTGCATNNGYIMNTCLPRGTAQRHLHPREVTMLCDLGYSVAFNAFFGSNAPSVGEFSNFEQYTGCSGQLCLPIGQADAATTASGVPVSLTAVSLLANDIGATGIHLNSFEVLGGTAVGTVAFNGTTMTFSPSPIFSGTALVRYLPVCNGVPGAFTYVVIEVEQAAIADCNLPANSCNMICHGDVENVNTVAQNSSFRVSYGNINSGSNTPDFFFPGNYNYPFNNFQSVCNIATPNGPSNLALGNPNTGYASMSAYSGNIEALGFSLNQSLQSGITYELTYLSYTACPNARLAFIFSDAPPCSPANGGGTLHNWINVPNPSQLGNTTPPSVATCPTYQPEFWVNSSVTPSTANQVWVRNTVTFSGVPAGTNLDNLVVLVENRYNGHMVVDDFTLQPVTASPLDITTSITYPTCLGDEAQLTYDICSPTAVTGLNLNAQLPALGLHFAVGGDFTNGAITNLSIPAGGCVTVTLNLEFDAGTVVGTTLPVQLVANGTGACVSAASNASVNVVRQPIAGNTLSASMLDLTNSGPYQAGDQVDLQVTFANANPTNAVTGGQAQVQLPAQLSVVSNGIPANFSVPAASTVSYTVRVEVSPGSFCGTVEPCVAITAANNACDLPITTCLLLSLANTQWPLVQIEADKGQILDLQEDFQGNVFATGHLVDVTFNGSNQTGNSFFLAKLDECGQVEWFRRSFSAMGYSSSTSITMDQDSNLYLSGQLTGAVRFEGGNNPDVNTFPAWQGGRYGFIAKYTYEGDLDWLMVQYNQTFAELHEVQYDPATGDIFTTGTLDPNNASFFLLYSNPGLTLSGLTLQAQPSSFNRAASLLRMDQNGGVTWRTTYQKNGFAHGRYLEFKGKEVVVAVDQIFSKTQAASTLLYYTTSGLFVNDGTFYPGGALYHQAFGLALDAQGNAYVQTTTWPTQETYISKYKVTSGGIGPFYFSQPLPNYGSSHHSLNTDMVHDQLVSQLVYTPGSNPVGIIVGLDQTANSWNQAVAAPVIHSFFTANPSAMTRGIGGNIYSGGSIPGTATFDLFGTALQASSVGFRDFYVTRHQYNGNAPAIFNRVWLDEPAIAEALAPFSEGLDNEVQVFPNPANYEATVQWQLADATEAVTLQVFDVSGRILFERAIPAGQTEVLLRTSQWVPGPYFISIQSQQYREVKTLMIQH